MKYDQNFLKAWAELLGEPAQEKLREKMYCGLYAISSPTLQPQYSGPLRHKTCLRELGVAPGLDPERQLVPLSMYVMNSEGQVLP